VESKSEEVQSSRFIVERGRLAAPRLAVVQFAFCAAVIIGGFFVLGTRIFSIKLTGS
jgi:hypothetical protein